MAVLSLVGLGAVPANASEPAPAKAATPEKAAKPARDPARVYHRMVQKVANMVNDDRAYRVAQAFGLHLLDVLWEDAGRWEGSSVGPNISDVTIEVEGYAGGKRPRTYLMPVMRHDNFTDKTADIRTDEIMIPVGNHEDGGALEVISLKELLENPGEFMSAPDKGAIKGESLLAKRDTHVLVSAQHAFLPVPEGGQAKFWPVIFNYQSTKKNPAVLTILVTRQGTSMTIIDNAHDVVGSDESGSWGQRLYFNEAGARAPLVAERLADVKASGVTTNGESAASLGDDSNVLMLIQVPLKYRAPRPKSPTKVKAATKSTDAMGAMGAPSAGGGGGYGSGRGSERSNVDTAVLGHGPTEGEFSELDGLTIARDPRFPVRVTLQFYQATSNGVVSRADVKAMAAQIKKVYKKGDFVGSLVVPTEADRKRPTNWDGVSTAPPNVSWRDFPGLVEHVSIARVRPGLF
jgi:hypothetical protein